ncbi:MAG: Diacylglycerol O-acyltransferase [Aeromicrobium sp.]|nr:Diacylglycerol O-acyltransferase [Aeromicrobium sp.]
MRRLSGWDAVLLYSETPTLHNHTLKIAVIDAAAGPEPFTFELFKRTFERRLDLLPPLRYQLVNVPLGIHHPMWREGVDVDFDFHIRKVQVPAPGGRRELDALIGDIVSVPLDRSRPLWEFHFVEGLAGGQVAVVGKIHHALADGVAAANLMSLAVEPTAGSTVRESQPRAADPLPPRAQVVRAAAADHWGSIRRLPGVVRRTVTGVRRMRREGPPPPARDTSAFEAPPTFFNVTLSARRAFATQSIPLAEMKSTSKALGVTLNDLLLGMVAGAIRSILLDRHEPVCTPLLAGVPLSTDTSASRISGNKLGGMVVSIPIDCADPLERCRLVHASAKVAKQRADLLGHNIMQDWMEYVPPRPTVWISRLRAERKAKRNKLMNLSISNVPGPRVKGFIAGTPIDAFYSVGPLSDRTGINITAWSYGDQMNVSVLTDRALVPEPHILAERLSDQLRLVQAAMAESTRGD